MGFFLYEWRSHEYRKKNFLTNHEWLSRRDEIKIPHARRSRKWGIFISSQLLSHDVMSEEIYPSLFLSRLGLTFSYCKGKLQQISSVSRLSINTMTFILMWKKTAKIPTMIYIFQTALQTFNVIFSML